MAKLQAARLVRRLRDFLRDKIEQELSWAFRCKGCGEMYVIRPIAGAEVTHAEVEQVHCHKSGGAYSYVHAEIERLWIP